MSAEPAPTRSLPDRRLLALALVGGALGTAVRAGVEQWVPHAAGSWPWSTFAVNLTGAFLLGALLEILARRESSLGPHHGTRTLLGTGLLGGFTTYSAFALEVVRLPPAVGMTYAVLSATLGVAAAATGYALARGRPSEPVPEPGS